MAQIIQSGVNVRIIGQNNKYLYLFSITPSQIKPHQFDNLYMIRLDGQSRIAPHYYIEAMFRQIKYPDLGGRIEFTKINTNRTELIIAFETMIFNRSPLQNEKNVIITIKSQTGILNDWSPYIVMGNRYEYYGAKGRQYLIRKLDDILFYGSPFHDKHKIRFSLLDHNINNDKELFLQFGGEHSPQKESYYKFKVVINKASEPEIKIIEERENMLLSEVQKEKDSSNKE